MERVSERIPMANLIPATKSRRRDFLFIATSALAAAGAVLATWPFIDQMNPSSGVLATGGLVTVDLGSIVPGQQIVVVWRSRPVFIVNRTPAILAQLRQPSLLDRLRDPFSQEIQQPDYATNWSRSIKPKYLVIIGVCTHLGCIPQFHPKVADPSFGLNWPGGYFCPCHGSKYDMAGRVFQGVPAPFNLPVPPYRFANDTTLVLGENPHGEAFSMSSLQKI